MPRLRPARLVLAALACAALALPSAAAANPLSGAIFTTLSDGSEVNLNQFPSKEAVYLDGGPGPGAPIDAAGLPAGRYVFQVTNPNGRTLLSTDKALCRQFDVSGGIITSVVPTGCQHLTGLDIDHGATTVQLMPYNDTPNPGGVYKVWVTPLADFLGNCLDLGEPNGLDVVNCGNAPGNRHGFVPADSKTDNFKVKSSAIVEIDTRFFDRNTGAILDGRFVTWTDTNGATNKKWSYYKPSLLVFHEAHVEAVEAGTHQITVADQPGCAVAQVTYDGDTTNGPTTVSVPIKSEKKDLTVFIDVDCD